MEIDDNTIKRFFSGACSRYEAEAISNYLIQHPDMIDTYFKEGEWLEEIQARPINEIPYVEKDLLEKIKSNVQLNENGSSKKRIVSIAKYWAAASLIGICVFIALHYYGVKKPEKTTASVKQTVPAIISDSVVWVNNSGSVESKELSDGSIVFLRSGSTLRYTKHFEANRRLLQLNGTAKFVVAENEKKPFTVVAGNISTTALGTIFYVHHPDNKKNIVVSLLKGKVVVKNTERSSEKIYLLPGEKCDFNGDGLIKYTLPGKKRTIPVEPTFIFKDSSYSANDSLADFKNARLTVVFKVIERLFHIHIDISGIPTTVLENSLYSGSIDKNKLLPEEALLIITTVNDLSIEKLDADTTIYRIVKK